MSATSVLIVVAVLQTVTGGIARVDTGFMEGLRPGDSGSVFYELAIGAQRKRIEIGSATVQSVEADSAALEVPADARPGYLVRFELPVERAFAPDLIEMAQSRLDERGVAGTLRSLIDRMIPRDSQVEEQVIRILRARGAEGAARPAVVSATAEPLARGEALAEKETVEQATARGVAAGPRVERIARLAGGLYSIGLDLEDAQFYSQQPRFRIGMKPYHLDLAMVTRKEFREFRPDHVFPGTDGERFVTGVTFGEADAYCGWRSKRLPSEFEWEVAMVDSKVQPGLMEWTSSWYKPYPGNDHPEPGYGEKVRVIRGVSVSGVLKPRHRSFATPATRDSKLGFRCAQDDTGDL